MYSHRHNNARTAADNHTESSVCIHVLLNDTNGDDNDGDDDGKYEKKRAI